MPKSNTQPHKQPQKNTSMKGGTNTSVKNVKNVKNVKKALQAGDLSLSLAIKKKRRKSQDGVYNRKTYNQKRRQKQDQKKPDILVMRSDNRLSFVNENQNEEKIRTTTMLKRSAFLNVWKGKDKNKILKDLQEILLPKYEEVTTFRRVVKVLERDQKTGSPVKVLVATPKKKNKLQLELEGKLKKQESDDEQYILERVLSLGDMSFFISKRLKNFRTDKMEEMQLAKNNDFFKSDEYQKIQAIHSVVKYVTQDVNLKLLNKTAKEIEENHGIREKGQNQVMVAPGVNAKYGSANNYANKIQVLYNGQLKWEWLHLVAHMILGKASQEVTNLVGGTTHANTAMIIAEREMRFLAEQYPQGFKLEISAELVEGTHMARKIIYKIITEDFELPLEFNAFQPNKPHIDFGHYFRERIIAMVELAKAVKTNQTTNTNAVPNNNNNNDYNNFFYDNLPSSPIAPKDNYNAKPTLAKNLFSNATPLKDVTNTNQNISQAKTPSKN